VNRAFNVTNIFSVIQSHNYSGYIVYSIFFLGDLE